MVSKALGQGLHAIRRARERFDFSLDYATYQKIGDQIRAGNAKFVERQSNRISLFEVELNGESCVAVYDRKRHTVVTFLTMEMVGISVPAYPLSQQLQKEEEFKRLTKHLRRARNDLDIERRKSRYLMRAVDESYSVYFVKHVRPLLTQEQLELVRPLIMADLDTERQALETKLKAENLRQSSLRKKLDEEEAEIHRQVFGS